MPSHEETLLSAGIDIGTSTTKLVISRFTLMNMAGGMHVPRIEIIDKEVLYRSPIFRTPLLSPSVVDMQSIDKIVHAEYEKAGVSVGDIQTGAIIITGETATKQNAEEMVHHLSDTAGEFLVATAGPDLEGIIAAKGSGAYDYAKRTGKTVANVDIGGGTANIAVYAGEKVVGTCTLHIGGHLIEFESGKIKNISRSIQQLIERKDWNLRIGDSETSPALKKVTHFMSKTLMRTLLKEMTAEDEVLLLGHQPNWPGTIDVVTISGGISECIYNLEEKNGTQVEYDDIGMELAAAIRNEMVSEQFEWQVPKETVRATVLGAGTQTTNISGATIQVESKELPQKNLPVFEITFENDFTVGKNKLMGGMKEAVKVYDPASEGQNFVLYLTNLPYLRFKDIQLMATELLDARLLKPKPDQPLIIVLQSDHAKALGQTLKALDGKQSILCVDQIEVEHGDYMDIGQIMQSGVVPVVIKTLTFHS